MEILNQAYLEENFLHKLSASFQATRKYSTPNIAGSQALVLNDAFPLAVLPNFLDEAFAKSLKEAVEKLSFRHKANDLFDFYQSADLKSYLSDEDSPIARMCGAIFSPEFVGAVSRAIGKPLGTEVDFAAQMYRKGQYLLCHDDRLESRRVAFVLYLVDEQWAETDGGEIELFRTDWRGDATPRQSQSFLPAWNTLVFFEVAMWSHHQVCEVLGGRPRLSVAGWLHDLPDGPRHTTRCVDGRVQTLSLTGPVMAAAEEALGCDHILEEVLVPKAAFHRLFFTHGEPRCLQTLLMAKEVPGMAWATLPTVLRLDSRSCMEAWPLEWLCEDGRRACFILCAKTTGPAGCVTVNGRRLRVGDVYALSGTAADPPLLSLHELEAGSVAWLILWSAAHS